MGQTSHRKGKSETRHMRVSRAMEGKLEQRMGRVGKVGL